MRRAYRILLLLLPAELRQEWGDEMEAVLARRLEAAGSPVERARIWVGAAADVGVQAVAARLPGRGQAGAGVGAPRPGGSWSERTWQDVRWAVRGLRKAPAFTLVAVMTLALGVGAVTAVFTVVNAVVLRPLPYHEPDRLVSIWPDLNFNAALVDRVAEGVPALAAVTGVSGWELTLEGGGEPMRLDGAVVSWNHFEVLGVQPVLGRGFLEEERDPERSGVVVLSHGVWVQRFGADPGIVGRTLRIGGRDRTSRTVVGVMGADFRPVLDRQIDAWVPLDVPPRSVAEDDSWFVNDRIGRLAPGASLALAEAQLRRVAANLHVEVPHLVEEEDVARASIRPLKSARLGDMDRTLGILLGAVGLVLMIACANVANLLLARGEARERDLAVRRAVGAGRGRLVRQLLTESLAIGVVGGGLGVLLAWWGVTAIMRFAPADFPRAGEVAIDGTVVLAAVAVSLVSALAFGLIPALRASGERPAEALRSAGRSLSSGRTRRGSSAWLVAAEVALAMVLVTGSGLMIRTLAELGSVDPGYDPEGVLAARVVPPTTRYADSGEFPRFYQRALEAVRAVPGVRAASGIHLLPATSGNWQFPVFPEGVEIRPDRQPPQANFRIVQLGWFETMGIPVLRGRTFTAEDGPDAPQTVVVNEAFARRHWAGENPVGREVGILGTAPERTYRVVGVVGDVHQTTRDVDPLPEVYVLHQGRWGAAVSFWFTVRADGDPLALAHEVRTAIWSVDAAVPVTDVDRMERVIALSSGTTRFVALLLGLFGGIALLLGAVGVYGVTSYTVARRVPEFGVRMALGADRGSVLGFAIADGLRPVLGGLAVGAVVAALGADVMEGLLFGVPPRDPWTLAAVASVLAVTAAAATGLPAFRATRVDPARVLREE